jgi:hypothetical protein
LSRNHYFPKGNTQLLLARFLAESLGALAEAGVELLRLPEDGTAGESIPRNFPETLCQPPYTVQIKWNSHKFYVH